MTLCTISRLPAQIQSHKLPLVLIHGWGYNHKAWQPLLDNLTKDRDYLCVDLPGFGEAPPLATDYSWQDVIEDLNRQLPQAFLVAGWSLGGMLAVKLAASNKAAKGLLTLASNSCFVAREDYSHAMATTTFDAFANQFTENCQATHQRFIALQLQPETSRKALLHTIKPLLPTGIHASHWQTGLLWLSQLDNRQTLNELTIPQHHLFGDKDSLMPSTAAATIVHSQLLSDAGHLLPFTHIPQIKILINKLDVATIPKSLPKKERVAQSFSKAAATYDSAARLQLEVGEHLVALIPTIAPDDSILDIGCGTGFLSRKLAPHKLIALDIATGMLNTARNQLGQQAYWLQADAEMLPLTNGSQGGVIANLSLQWCDLNRTLQEITRVLKPGGWCLFSTLGSESLWELKQTWQLLDGNQHVNDFLSKKELHSALTASGLQPQHLTSRHHQMGATRLRDLLTDLKAIGARNLNDGRQKGLMTPRQWSRLNNFYEIFRNKEGYLTASYDVIYVLAYKQEVMN